MFCLALKRPARTPRSNYALWKKMRPKIGRVWIQGLVTMLKGQHQPQQLYEWLTSSGNIYQPRPGPFWIILLSESLYCIIVPNCCNTVGGCHCNSVLYHARHWRSHFASPYVALLLRLSRSILCYYCPDVCGSVPEASWGFSSYSLLHP